VELVDARWTVPACAALLLAAAPAASAAPSMPRPTGVKVIYSACPGAPAAAGCAYADNAAIIAGIYGDACHNPDGCIYLANHDRFNRLHELGHVWDEQNLTDTQRGWFTRLLGARPGRPWLTGLTGDPAPGEQFADAYANCVIGNGFGRRAGSWETGYDYNFRARRHRRICIAIEAIGYMHEHDPGYAGGRPLPEQR
jgi:hypothetical protein